MDFFKIRLQCYTIILLITTLSIITGSNIDCNGKAFHCVNSTHFKICVDLGGSVSTTVDELVILCPPNTVCREYNLFECEYELTTLPPVTIQSEVTNDQFQTSDNSVSEQLDITILIPTKQQQGMELSEKYNKINTTPASFTEVFSTDAVKYHVTSNNTNDLLTSSDSDIIKTLNISQGFDKEVTFSTTESGNSVTPTTPYNINRLVTEIGVSNNDNSDIPELFTTIERSTINSLNSESFQPSNQNRLDLSTRLTVTKRTNKVSSVSEPPYSDMVTLLTGNFSDPLIQENTLLTSSINRSINSDNVSQEYNQDNLNNNIRTQLNNSNNNIDHNMNSLMHSTNKSFDKNTLNSTTNVFTNDRFTSDVPNMNKKSDVNRAITSEPSRQHLVEETTASTKIVLGTTNQMSSPISLNKTEAIETFLNGKLNITTNVEKLSITDDYIKISTSIIPEITAVKTNEMSSKITNPGLNYDVALSNPIIEEKNAALSDKTSISEVKSSKITKVNEILNLKNVAEVKFTTQLDSINIIQYLTTTEPYWAHERSDKPSLSTSKSEIIQPINNSDDLNLSVKEASQVNNASKMYNVNTIDVSTNTDMTNDTHPNFIIFDKIESTRNPKKHLTMKSATYDKIIVGDYSSTRVNTLPVLPTVDMANETQTTDFNLFNELMSKRKPKGYDSTTVATTVALESTTSDKIESKGFGPTGIDMLPVLKKGDEATETQAGVTVLEQIALIKNLNDVSDLNSSLFLNTSVSSNYNTIFNVMANDSSTIFDTLPTLTTKMVFSSDHSTAIKSTTTDKPKLVGKESYVMKVNETETWPEPDMVTVATDLTDSNRTTEINGNVEAEISNGVTSLKPIPNLISKNNNTFLKQVMVIVATDIDNYNNITTEMGNNNTEVTYNRVTSLKSVSGLKPTTSKIQLTAATDTFDSVHKENVFGTTSKILTDQQSFKEPTTTLSSPNDYILKTKHFDTIEAVWLISSTDSVISERNTKPIITSSTITLNKPNIFTDRSSGALGQVNVTIHNDNSTKPVINSVYEINHAVSPNASTFLNKMYDVYETRTESDIALFESANSVDVTNNTSAITDVLSEYRAAYENNKRIENTSKLESAVTIYPTTYINSNIRSNKYVILTETTLTRPSPDSDKKEIDKKQVNSKNTTNNIQNVDMNMIGNPNLIKPTTENISIAKFVTANNFSQLVDSNIGMTDVKPNQSKNNLVESSLTFDDTNIDNIDLNSTDKNVITPVSSNSKTIPLKYLPTNLTNPPLTDIYNMSHNYFSENIILTNRTDKKNMLNHDTEYKKSNQTYKNKLATALGISNIEHEGNKTKNVPINPYKQITTSAKEVNETIFKELSYNFSEPSLIERNNQTHDSIIINKTSTTSADKNIAPKQNYDTKISSITNNKTVNKLITNLTELEDYSQLNEISKSQSSGNAIKSLLIGQKQLEAINNTTSFHTENRNLSLITENGFTGYVSHRINKSKINVNNYVNKSQLSTPVQNITSSNNLCEHIKNWTIVNSTVVANVTRPSKTLTYDSNVSEVKSLTVIKTKENYTNDLIATSESSITASNLLKHTSSQTNSIKNKTHQEISKIALEFSRIMPSKFDKSSPLNILNVRTTALVSNITKPKVTNEQDITISEHAKRSNGTEKKQPQNSNGYSESLFPTGNGVIKNITNYTQNGYTTPTTKINYTNSKYRNVRTSQDYKCTKRGKYSDTNDCNKFYICIGRVMPIIGVCPTHTVFSEFLKQCTKNITHCIRNNQFKCTAAGRFVNILCNNTYFICAKKNAGFIRFTLKCQKGYYIDKNNIKCIPELINISISDENSSKNTEELSVDNYKKMEEVSVKSENYFECKKEGKFKNPQDCRKYYVCRKGRKSTFRRIIKTCDSEEVFHTKKKKCVDEESYECDI